LRKSTTLTNTKTRPSKRTTKQEKWMTIQKVGILSLAKLFGIYGFIIGFIAATLQLLASAIFASAISSGAPLIGGGLSLIIMPFILGVTSFLAGSMAGFIYNVILGLGGGLEIKIR